MEELKPIKISIEYDGNTLTLTTPGDSDITEWKDVFKVILTFLTFAPETIKELFAEE